MTPELQGLAKDTSDESEMDDNKNKESQFTSEAKQGVDAPNSWDSFWTPVAVSTIGMAVHEYQPCEQPSDRCRLRSQSVLFTSNSTTQQN